MIVKIDKAFQQITQVLQILKDGGMIAIPTDTIYGLAVDATDERAVKRLVCAKKRSDKHFTLFMPKSEIGEFAVIAKHKIIDFFMPGQLTVILRKRPNVLLPYVTEKIGIRIPQHNFVLRLLSEHRKPLAVTSANISGEPPLTSPYDIVEHFTDARMVIDDGLLFSLPSTVLDLTMTPPLVMRKGAIPILAIEKVYGRRIALAGALKFNVLFVCSGNTCRSPMAAGILKTMVSMKYSEVQSAGTIAMGGLQAAHYAKQVVKEFGGSIDRHRTNSLDRELVDWADLILVMEYKHYETVLEINPDAVVKTFLLREYKHKTKYTEVPDPVGRDLAAYQQAARKMYPTLKRIAQDIKGRFRRKT
ncbi:MAG: L-threonylcarbamoyladenylate synthase [candidate division WOR-3 bacterium]|jgi:tRNA threonylcarbamoyl adenosine modification protein (Sua5/YciO/YrdC/YwlC family)